MIKPMHAQGSIVTQEHFEGIVRIAKENLIKDGSLVPVLFVRLDSGTMEVGALDLPHSADERRAYLFGVGRTLREKGKVIDEAVLVMEGWFVEADKAVSPLSVPPSQHPQRQEAIVVIGRDAKKTRLISLIQPFGRNDQHEPIWGQVKVIDGMRAVGLLDALFAEG